MTYLGASAAALATDRNTWHTRADQAWGSTRQWNYLSSFETDLANMTADRNTWQGRANTAYDGGTWGSGTHWHTRHDNLLAGLNNPEGLVYVSISLGWPGQNATSGTQTLSIPRTGHGFVGAIVDGTVNLNSYGSTITVNVGGVMSAAKTTNCGANSGTQQYHAGFQVDGDWSAGQVIQVSVSNQWVPSGSISGTLFYHFVPNATYHN